MPDRKNPSTSLSAYRQLHPEQVKRHHEKIISALQILGSATADKIAEYTGMEHVQVNRRISELARMEIIYKPGTKLPTRRGRDAYVWTLSQRGKVVEHKTEKPLPGKTVSDYSRDLVKTTPQQIDLFD